ncbi:hypothetical protein C2869_02950 [Saccharobesus litoralis]|uniref:Uncharacterized protein n=1 Tax=Saccharobesus litoralis TaxID=2172099 RepID=A0A2S0VMN9_9ALTE|nr:hypothetical protein [Saccharobesus litoralis]AWB65456.1 hypothetical protein C2869_02950 [Saccharobesus litoralis]
MNDWILQDFNAGEINCQIIEFKVSEISYVMLFNRIDATRDQNAIDEKAAELGLEYRENSYEIKFDLKDNFDNDNYFAPRIENFTIVEMRFLGRTVRDLIEFHYRNTNAEAYLFAAENDKLKRYYDGLAKKYSGELNFKVVDNLGEEELGYEITTPSYKS